MDEDTYQEILDMPQVEDAAVYTRRMDYNNSLYYGNEGIDGCEMLGVDNSYFETCQLCGGPGPDVRPGGL